MPSGRPGWRPAPRQPRVRPKRPVPRDQNPAGPTPGRGKRRAPDATVSSSPLGSLGDRTLPCPGFGILPRNLDRASPDPAGRLDRDVGWPVAVAGGASPRGGAHRQPTAPLHLPTGAPGARMTAHAGPLPPPSWRGGSTESTAVRPFAPRPSDDPGREGGSPSGEATVPRIGPGTACPPHGRARAMASRSARCVPFHESVESNVSPSE